MFRLLKISSFIGCIIFFLIGCTPSGVSYDLHRFGKAKAPDIAIIDLRTTKDKKYRTGCGWGDPIDNIGDENITPSKIELLKRSLVNQNSKAKFVKVKQFDIQIYYPNQCSVLRNVSMFTGYYNGSDVDGIRCQIELEIDGQQFSGKSFIPNQSGVRELMGLSVSGTKLENTISEVVDMCVKNAFLSRKQ